MRSGHELSRSRWSNGSVTLKSGRREVIVENARKFVGIVKATRARLSAAVRASDIQSFITA
jgi:hypothetical protein